MITERTVPQRPLTVRARRLDGGLCIANDLDAVRLSPVAEAVWRLVDGTMTIGQVAEAVAERFGAAPEVVLADVKELLGGLADRGLVALS